MKTKVVDYWYNICRVPCQSRTWKCWDDFKRFWPIQAAFVVREPLCEVEIPSWAHNFNQDHLMKSEGLIANVMSVGSPAKAEHGFLGWIWTFFWPIQAALGVGEEFCDLEIPS